MELLQSEKVDGLHLLTEFPHPSLEDWRELVRAESKGDMIEKRLIGSTWEGIELQPIYGTWCDRPREKGDTFPGSFPYRRGTSKLGYHDRSWDVLQQVYSENTEELADSLSKAGGNGVTGLYLQCGEQGQKEERLNRNCESEWKRTGGSIFSVNNFRSLCNSAVDADLGLFFSPQSVSLPLAASLIAALPEDEKHVMPLRGSLSLDPLGQLAGGRDLPCSLPAVYDQLASLLGKAAAIAPSLKVLCSDSVPYHESGGHAVQELGFALATALDYLREMAARGISLDTAASHLMFSYAIGPLFFMEVAKFRAARTLWAKVVRAAGAGLESGKADILARTSRRNRTSCGVHNNILRGTVEAFAAIVGGVNHMLVGGFDETNGTSGDFAAGIARNTQLILREESHLDHVTDPAGGSWYVESLTDELARKAWKLFQLIEEEGGMYSALQKGIPQKMIAETASQRKAAMGKRREVLVGVSRYCQETETRVSENLSPSRTEEQKDFARQADSAVNQPTTRLDEVLVPLRLAEPFENLRLAMDRFRQKEGKEPQVLLACFGSFDTYKPRMEFSREFFSLAGFSVKAGEGCSDTEEAARRLSQEAAALIVLCSSDDLYPHWVPAFTAKWKSLKPDIPVLLAGYPQDHLEAFRSSGVDDFIHIRSNVLETLTVWMKKLGILA